MHRLLPVALALASVASAGIISITDIVDTNGLTTVSPDGTFVVAPDGTSFGLLSWTGVRADASNSSSSDLSLSGTFSCGATEGYCFEAFSLDLTGTGFGPGTTAFMSLVGFSSTNLALESWFVQQDAVTTVPVAFFNGTGPFDVSSATFAIDSGGNFSGTFFLFIFHMGNGNFSLPALSSADLIVADGSVVPEPGTIAIVAACILLLIYVKRLRCA